MVTKTTEIGTARRPLRSVTLPARADGGDTILVINDVRRPRRGHGAHRVALTGGGLMWWETRSNRGVLLAITGIIAHKNQFRAKSGRREHSTPGYAFAITVGRNPLQSLSFARNRAASADVPQAACDAPIAGNVTRMSTFCSR